MISDWERKGIQLCCALGQQYCVTQLAHFWGQTNCSPPPKKKEIKSNQWSTKTSRISHILLIIIIRLGNMGPFGWTEFHFRFTNADFAISTRSTNSVTAPVTAWEFLASHGSTGRLASKWHKSCRETKTYDDCALFINMNFCNYSWV